MSVAFSSAVPQIEKVPTLQALEVLEEQGYETETVWFQSSEDPAQAVARGDAHFGSASSTAVLGAIATGIPLTAVACVVNPAYVIAASVDIASPAEIGGKRVAINSVVSSTTMHVRLMMNDNPGVAEPELLVIPGTPARVSALLAGQTDAAVLQLSAMPVLEEQAPGQFHSIYDVGARAVGLCDSYLFVNTTFLEQNREFVEHVTAEVIAAQAAAYSDTDDLARAIAQYVPDQSDPESAAAMAKLYVDAHTWAPDGGFSSTAVTFTLDRLEEAGLVDPIPTIDECCDLTVAP
ncbi:MAG TPA: ABC transporter substrate-binding protein [Terrimesophilobacter sp.]|nr:ABC transporter substrate-binding protein [Terrimesophilobacter sp.]